MTQLGGFDYNCFDTKCKTPSLCILEGCQDAKKRKTLPQRNNPPPHLGARTVGMDPLNNGDTHMTTLPIVGARFRPPAEEVLKLLPSGTKLLLRRQPDNPYDENAVQVLLALSNGEHYVDYGRDIEDILATNSCREPDYDDSLHLGFIPREAAKELAPIMDKSGGWQNNRQESGDIKQEFETPVLSALLTFGLTGLPMVSFLEPGETPRPDNCNAEWDNK